MIPIAEDGVLLRNYAERRDEKAFTQLVSRHVNLVYRAALRETGGDAHAAEEAAQQVFTLLARKAESLAGHPSLAGWLYTTTHHISRDLVRAQRRRLVRETKARLMHEVTARSESEANWEQIRPALDGAMQKLSRADREAILLRFFEERSFQEVGALLAVSEDAARMRVDRALAKLRALLGRRGATSTTAALALMLANEGSVAAPAGLAGKFAAAALGGATLGPSVALTLMSMNKIIAGLATVGAIVALGIAGFEFNVNRALAAAVAATQAERDTQAERVRDLMRRAETAERAAEHTSTQVADIANGVAAGQVTSQTLSNEDMIANGAAYFTAHPDAKKAFDDRARARTHAKYGILYDLLKLSGQQIEQFETLNIEDNGMTWSYNGKPALLQAGTGLSRDEVDRRLRQLLGEEGFQQYQTFDKLVPAWRMAAGLAGALYLTDTPLTEQQAAQFIPIVAGSLQSDWESARARFQSVLAPAQLAALEGVWIHEQLSQAWNDRGPHSRGRGPATAP